MSLDPRQEKVLRVITKFWSEKLSNIDQDGWFSHRDVETFIEGDFRKVEEKNLFAYYGFHPAHTRLILPGLAKKGYLTRNPSSSWQGNTYKVTTNNIVKWKMENMI